MIIIIFFQIAEGDGLPQNVCDECVKNLHIMYTFRNQAISSENQLRKIVSESFLVKNEREYTLKHENEADFDIDSYNDFIYDTDTTKVETNTEISMYICNICNKRYTKRKRFLKHLSHHENQQVICPFCQKSFRKQSTLERHLEKHCNLQSYGTNNVDMGMVTHAVKDEVEITENSYQTIHKCNECNLVFDNEESRMLHYKEHLPVHIDLEHQVYRCLKCSMDFTRILNLLDHVIIHEPTKSKSQLIKVKTEKDCYECPECSLVFDKQRALGSHLKKHKVKLAVKSNDMYFCSQCQKGFTSKHLLTRHMKLHSEERPFKCTLCAKSYTRQDQLVIHMTKHDGKKRYPCSYCDKGMEYITESLFLKI